CAALGLLALFFPAGQFLSDWSYDLPFLFRSHQRIDNAVIVYLDEKSYADLKQEPSKFDRSLHAKLVRRLEKEGVTLVVFDFLFMDARTTTADHDFAVAMKDSKRVVLAAEFIKDRHSADGTMVLPPIDLFRTAAAGWGVASVHREHDFAARRIFL